ncbi:15547_t:CDS:2, partial [Acaulospora morrowiae]
MLNMLMFYWYGKPMWAIAYAIGCGVLFAVLPQPDYKGNTKIVKLTLEDLRDIQRNSYQVSRITEIKDDDDLDEKVKGKGKAENDNYWVVFFYVTWSNVCRNFESTVAKASLKEVYDHRYTTPNIHFGKFDIDESPELAQEYDISSAPTSLDLPTLILLKNGKEHRRLPWKVKDGTEEDLDRIKSEKLRSAKVMWDRLGWDRSMESIISEFKLDALH